MADYYDAILAPIAVAVVTGAVVSVHPAIVPYQGLAGGGVIATVLLCEILFRNPPTEPARVPTLGSLLVSACWLLTFSLYL
jgi:hypothetical protein